MEKYLGTQDTYKVVIVKILIKQIFCFQYLRCDTNYNYGNKNDGQIYGFQVICGTVNKTQDNET